MRFELHADGEKFIHSRSTRPQKKRVPTEKTHAVDESGSAERTVCGLATHGLQAFAGMDFETSNEQFMCRACRQHVAGV